MDLRIPYYRHDLGEPELQAVAEVLGGPILTTGETVDRFEGRFAELTGRKHALAVTSCTGAMHLSLMALGIGPGDEVITTPMSFIATATAILESGATPVFVDVEPETGNMDAAAVEAAVTERTKAIMPVHLYGLMCDMAALRAVADRHGLALVEDSAHCVEGMRDGIRPGALSATASYSFYATKNLTCGEGGALVTDDTALYEQLKLLRLHGMTKTAADRAREGYKHWDMVVLGWKYNMSNIEAALLLPQFDRVERNLARRHRLAALYESRFATIGGVRCQQSPEKVVHARHVFTIQLEDADRDATMQALRAAGIESVVNYRPIHLMSYFREHGGYRPGAYPNAEWIGERTISLPFYPTMPEEHVEIVADAVDSIVAAVPRAACR